MSLEAIRQFAARRAARYRDGPVPLNSVPSLADLLATSPEQFDREILEADPLSGRLRPECTLEAIAEAIADGQRRADALKGQAPVDIADDLGVSIQVVGGSNVFGSIFQFAEYLSRPPQILIYEAAMSRLRNLIDQHDLRDELGICHPEPVYVAHELYHHLMQLEPAPAQRLLPGLASSSHRSTRVVGIKEIGAAAFAAKLVGLQRHPRMLDKLVLLAN